MARRKFLRYIQTDLPDKATENKYLLTFNRKQLYHTPHFFPALTAQALFQNNHPFHLEIGCGCGDFLCAQAKQNPNAVFVGIDISRKPLYNAVYQASKMTLNNIKFIHTDFKLVYPLLSPNTVDQVYLHFPDPHHQRKRFRSRRLFTTKFLGAMSHTLKPSGKVNVITDVIEYFAEMLLLVEKDPRFQKAHPTRYLIGFESETKSRYQRVWERHGLPTLRFEIKKS